MSDRIQRFLKEYEPETPCLVVDLDVVEQAYRSLRDFLPVARIFYAVKANPEPKVVERLNGVGSSFDTASRGEIDLCMQQGVTADRISFGNTIKKEKDIAWAHAKGVRLFAFDSEAELAKQNLHFVGMGVSGGELGALRGPSLMPGGPREAYDVLEPMLVAIAAKSAYGPCVSYIGPGGSGHYVKMIHNGIEYGDMQLIAETYDVMRSALGMPAELVEDIRLAITEACTNVVRHAYADDDLGVVEVRIRPQADSVLVTVTDFGRGIGTSADTSGPGLGLPLIAAVADTVDLQPMPGGGSRVAMTFARNSPGDGE